MHNKRSLLNIRKPSRYIGNEPGSIKKNWTESHSRICLIYPDDYELGTSSIGLSILYHLINDKPNMLADRLFTPWIDREKQLAEQNEKVQSLDHNKNLDEFDAIGFTLPFELTYTNILTTLKLAGIPFYSNQRDNFPFIIGGGSASYNPEPIADLFDIIIIGDGEDILPEIMHKITEFKNENKTINHNLKQNFLSSLTKLDGIYVPSLKNKTKKTILKHIEYSAQKPIVPHHTVHQRAAIEIARGCLRGCRFCQAGFTYRPLRQRKPQDISSSLMKTLDNTGHNEASLLSLSISDYEPIKSVLSCIHNSYDLPVKISLPSLRAESLNFELLNLLGNDRSGSFTLAPEAGSEKLRKFINKGNTEEDLLKSVSAVFSNGWHRIKLYFMIGFPNETDEDLDAIAELAKKCLNIGRKYHGRRTEIVVSASTFIPKPHTPFQWETQIDSEETIRKQTFLRKLIKTRGLIFKCHNPKMSQLEGIFSRGNRKLCPAIISAWENGARFDGWEECFSWETWEKAFEQNNINWKTYLEAKNIDDELPWDHLFTQLKKDFLVSEKQKACDLINTTDCKTEKCNDCGICKNGIKNVIEDDNTKNIAPIVCNKIKENDRKQYKYRFHLTKTESASLLGNIEFTSAIKRCFIKAKLPLEYTQGFNPKPRISFPPANSIGIDSFAEYFDVCLESPIDIDEIIQKLELPNGSNLISINEIISDTPKISDIKAWKYRLNDFPETWKTALISNEHNLEIIEDKNDLIIIQKLKDKSAVKQLAEILSIEPTTIIPHLIKESAIF